MNSKVLSIIIPTYNMEDYLGRNLDSLVKAKEVLPKIEIIVVNDGSKDRSLDIANSYKKEYPNSLVVVDKLNGNYGSCINAGLRIATGKYVKVLDADDVFYTQALIDIVEKLSTEPLADLVVTNYVISYLNSDKKILIHYDLPINRTFVLDSMSIAEKLYGLQMHAIIYRTDLLRDNSYTQTEGISYTDQEWCFFPMFFVKTIRYYNIDLYDYKLGREGQTMSRASMKKMLNHFVIVAKRMLESFTSLDRKSMDKPRYEYLRKRVVVRFKDIYHLLLVDLNRSEFNKDDFLKFDSYVSKKNRRIYWEIMVSSVYKKYLPIPYIILYKLFGIRF